MADPVQELMAAGEFDSAAAALDEALEREFDVGRAIQLFGVHAYRGDPDRAEAILRRASEHEPQLDARMLLDRIAAVRVYLCRRDSQAEAGHRNFVFGTPGKAPAPEPWLALMVQASVEHAGGDRAAAAKTLAEARGQEPEVGGTIRFAGEERRFSHIRDSDDLTGATVPCLVGPSLVDVAYTELGQIEFGERQASWDWLWLPALLTLRDGRQFDAAIPSRYPGTGQHSDPAIRLSQMTFWNNDNGYALGVGMVDLVLDPKPGVMVGIERVESISFD